MSLGQASAPSGAHRPVRVGLVAWSSLFLIVVAPFVSAGQHYRDVLGLRPGMPERDVHARMEKLGKPAGGESEEGEGRRETWLLRDRRFASITFEFDSEMALDWATAFVRPRGKGRGVRYTDIGDIGRAQRYGNYIYTWVLPVVRTGRQIGITARGSDSIWISSVSIHRYLRDSVNVLPGGVDKAAK